MRWPGVLLAVVPLVGVGGGRLAAEQWPAEFNLNECLGDDDAEGKTQCLLRGAEQGDASAQVLLGVMYYEGQGVTQDYAEAVRWSRKAADQGNADAQFLLGVMYYEGQGVTQDYAEAVKWYRKAAEQGDADAQLNLGFMYGNGQGVTQDYSEAVRWYRKAIEQGHAGAQYNLGVMYSKGQGVTKDHSEAAKWYRKAAEQGDANAQYNLGVMYDEGQVVPQNYGPWAHLAEAVKWYRKAAEQGNAHAQFKLGVMYHNGWGVPRDYAEAVKWYRKAANQGNAGAQYILGVMYSKGQGVTKDHSEAAKWYRKARQGDAEAQVNAMRKFAGLVLFIGLAVAIGAVVKHSLIEFLYRTSPINQRAPDIPIKPHQPPFIDPDGLRVVRESLEPRWPWLRNVRNRHQLWKPPAGPPTRSEKVLVVLIDLIGVAVGVDVIFATFVNGQSRWQRLFTVMIFLFVVHVICGKKLAFGWRALRRLRAVRFSRLSAPGQPVQFALPGMEVFMKLSSRRARMCFFPRDWDCLQEVVTITHVLVLLVGGGAAAMAVVGWLARFAPLLW